MSYHAIPCHTVPCSDVPYRAISCHAVPYSSYIICKANNCICRYKNAFYRGLVISTAVTSEDVMCTFVDESRRAMFFPKSDIFEIPPEIVQMAPPLAMCVSCMSTVDDAGFSYDFQYDLLGWAEFGYSIQAIKTNEHTKYLNSVFSEVQMVFRDFEYNEVQSLEEIAIAAVINRKGLPPMFCM